MNHNLFVVINEGDLFIARCSACGWESDGFDTRKEARAAHTDHVFSERLKEN